MWYTVVAVFLFFHHCIILSVCECVLCHICHTTIDIIVINITIFIIIIVVVVSSSSWSTVLVVGVQV